MVRVGLRQRQQLLCACVGVAMQHQGATDG